MPDDVVALLDGQELASKEGEAFLLISTGESGRPHVAVLSVGEVVAPSPHELRLALWSTSRTTANLTRNGRAALFVVCPPAVCILQLTARRLGDLEVAGRQLACFSARVESVERHAVPYAEMACGPRFTLTQREAALERWARTVQALRAVGPGS